jgi:hypothetical protein
VWRTPLGPVKATLVPSGATETTVTRAVTTPRTAPPGSWPSAARSASKAAALSGAVPGLCHLHGNGFLVGDGDAVTRL